MFKSEEYADGSWEGGWIKLKELHFVSQCHWFTAHPLICGHDLMKSVKNCIGSAFFLFFVFLNWGCIFVTILIKWLNINKKLKLWSLKQLHYYAVIFLLYHWHLMVLNNDHDIVYRYYSWDNLSSINSIYRDSPINIIELLFKCLLNPLACTVANLPQHDSRWARIKTGLLITCSRAQG